MTHSTLHEASEVQPSPYNRLEKHRPMNFEGVCTFPTFFQTCLRVGSKLSLGTSRTRVSVTQIKMFAHQAYSSAPAPRVLLEGMDSSRGIMR